MEVPLWRNMTDEACPENHPWLILLKESHQLLLNDLKPKFVKKETLLNWSVDLLPSQKLKFNGSTIKKHWLNPTELGSKTKQICICIVALSEFPMCQNLMRVLMKFVLKIGKVKLLTP